MVYSFHLYFHYKQEKQPSKYPITSVHGFPQVCYGMTQPVCSVFFKEKKKKKTFFPATNLPLPLWIPAVLNFQANIFSAKIVSSVYRKYNKPWKEDIMHPSFPRLRQLIGHFLSDASSQFNLVLMTNIYINSIFYIKEAESSADQVSLSSQSLGIWMGVLWLGSYQGLKENFKTPYKKAAWNNCSRLRYLCLPDRDRAQPFTCQLTFPYCFI